MYQGRVKRGCARKHPRGREQRGGMRRGENARARAAFGVWRQQRAGTKPSSRLRQEGRALRDARWPIYGSLLFQIHPFRRGRSPLEHALRNASCFSHRRYRQRSRALPLPFLLEENAIRDWRKLCAILKMKTVPKIPLKRNMEFKSRGYLLKINAISRKLSDNLLHAKYTFPIVQESTKKVISISLFFITYFYTPSLIYLLLKFYDNNFFLSWNEILKKHCQVVSTTFLRWNKSFE